MRSSSVTLRTGNPQPSSIAAARAAGADFLAVADHTGWFGADTWAAQKAAAVAATTTDFAAIDVLEAILTMEPSGRLYKSLVEKKKAASVGGAAYALHDPGFLRFMAEVASGNTPEAVLDTLLDLKPGATKKDLLKAMEGHVLAEGQLMGTYQRK